MREVLPAFIGALFLLVGVGVTWLIATSGYTNPCRLSLELDNYSCWGVMGLPLAGGIGSMALGGAVLLRSILTLPLPRQLRVLRSSKILAVVGLLLLVGIVILSAQLLSVFAFGLNLQTFLFLTFVGIMVFTVAQWIQIYLHPTREFEDDSAAPSG